MASWTTIVKNSIARVIIPILISLWYFPSYSQNPVADFSSLSTACLNQNVKFTNNSANATSYIWDFCSSDLSTLSGSGQNITTVSASDTPIGISFIQSGGNWYGFMANRSGGKIYRLNFGTSLENTPTVIELVIAGLTGPENLEFVEEGGVVYAIAVDFDTKNIVRLNFSAGIETIPTAQNLGTFGLGQPRSIDLVKDGSNYVIAISDFGSSGIALINFGTSITNNPTGGDVTYVLYGSIPGAIGIRLVKDGNNWYGFVASFSSNSIKRIDFGTTLSATATIADIYSITNPTELSVQVEGSTYYILFATFNQGIHRLTLGSSANSSVASTLDLGNYGWNFGLDLVRSSPIWYAFAVDLNTKKIYRFKFNGNCTAVSVSSATTQDPGLIVYSAQGDYSIELTAISASGKADVIKKQITIQNTAAPSLTVSNDNVCLNSTVTFSVAATGPALVSWDWNFGDGQTSTATAPAHNYGSTGLYTVTLQAGASNGCGNYVEKNVSIYNTPVADFNLPTNNPLCTNQLFTFSNTSTADVGSNPAWEWSIDGVLTSTNEDLQQAFSDPSPKSIKLQASIPGCSNEITKILNSMQSGPTISFSMVSNGCKDQSISFTNTTTGSVTGYLWSFGDSQTSTQINPTHTYSATGGYIVTLEGDSPSGCQNSLTQAITIRSIPQTDFTAPIAPIFNATPVQFNDATPNPIDSNISSWLWDFDDAVTSNQEDPQHTFVVAGTYNVSLTTTTNYGCNKTIQKSIVISLIPTDFTAPSSACLSEHIKLKNNSINATSYVWDFCFEDLAAPTSGQEIVTVGASDAPIGISFVTIGGNWYGFLASRGNGKIYRLNFGSSLENTPTVVELSIAGLSGPENLEFIVEGGVLYAILVDFNSKNIVRLNFSSGIEVTPTAQNLGTFSMTQPRSIDLVKDGSNYIAAISDFAGNGIVLINFGNSITNNPTGADATNVLTGSIPGAFGVRLVKSGSNWHGFVASFSSNTIKRIDFGTTLSAIATVTDLHSITSPTELSVQEEGSNYYILCATFNQGIHRINLGSTVNGSIISSQDLGNFGGNFGFDLVRSTPIWYAFAVDLTTKKIYRFKFNGHCPQISSDFSSLENPALITYSAQGNYSIELTAFSVSDKPDIIKKQVTIQNSVAPSITISNNNSCLSSPITFLESFSDPSLIAWNWTFGDGQTSAVSGPSHNYSSVGTYSVSLRATSSNGCGNYNEKSISIYNAPVTSFSLPANNPLCTNQQFTFGNTTNSDVGSNPVWEWLIDDVFVSNTKDLQYAFEDPEPKTIKLRASIPGCSNEQSQVLNALQAGPLVNFSFSGECQNNAVDFVNTTTGLVLDYNWTFGDSQMSSAFSSPHTYTSIGTYTITLLASSPNGCQNSASKQITIRSIPQPNFSVALPPFSCSGTPTQFSDNTPGLIDSNISSWRWNFGDVATLQDTSVNKNPEYTFPLGGNYNVSLTVYTNYGCTASIVKDVAIAEAPSANFNHTPACEDVPVTFEDISTGDIVSRNWQLGNTSFSFANPTYTFSVPGLYPVSLLVTSRNNCIAYVEKTINVPYPVFPDFSVQKNCVGFPAEFADITAGVDKVVLRNWTFGNSANATGAIASHIFSKADDYIVKLEVTTQAGCIYSDAQTINIVKAPKAYFTATPEIGAPPLNAQFTNASENASAYLWSFNDKKNSTSRESSTQFMFQDYGDYVVDLTATNAQNCSHTFSRIITVTNPFINISLTSFVTGNNPDGTISSVVTLKNQSNVSVQNLKLLLDVAGIQIKEVIPGLIQPNASITFVPQFSLLKNERLNYVCATIEVENEIDKSDNQLCASFENEITFEPYPNPSADKLTVEWIADASMETKIQIIDALGHQEFMASYTSQIGLNQILLDLQSMSNGVYFLLFDSDDSHKKYRFAISR